MDVHQRGKMTTDQPSAASRPALPFIAALLITLVMGVGMTALDVWQPAEPRLSILAFLPGLVSIAVLLASGSSRSDLYLRFGKLSRPGLIALAVTTILLLPILGSTTGWGGWKWLPALVYAPASGIAQELYFRSSLLPALERALGGKKIPALLLHGLVFIGYHLRTFRSVPSLPIVAADRVRAVRGGLRVGLAGAEGQDGRLGNGAAQPVPDDHVDVRVGMMTIYDLRFAIDDLTIDDWMIEEVIGG